MFWGQGLLLQDCYRTFTELLQQCYSNVTALVLQQYC